jgi:hypothetical protein
LTELKEWGGKNLTPVSDFSNPNARGSAKAFATERVEKIGIDAFCLNEELHYGVCTIFPQQGYDLPIFVSKWEERETEITFLVDILPTVDTLVDGEYRRKYIEPMGSLWVKYSHLAGICPEENDTLRSLCSIIYTAARVLVDKEGMCLAALAPHTAYLGSYLAFLKSARRVDDDTKQQEITRKTKSIREILCGHFQEILSGSIGEAIGQQNKELMITIFS